MAERFNAAVLKTVDGVSRPGVRIPVSPPFGISNPTKTLQSIDFVGFCVSRAHQNYSFITKMLVSNSVSTFLPQKSAHQNFNTLPVHLLVHILNILFALDGRSIFITLKMVTTMQSNFNFIFYLKKRNNYVSGPIPIYLRITLKGKRSEISTGKSCEPDRWNASSGFAKGTSQEVGILNAHLKIIIGKVHQLHTQAVANGEVLNNEVLKNKLQGLPERSRTLIPIFIEHNQKIETLINDEYAPGTLERYKTSLKHTIDFLIWKFNVTDININKVDHAFIVDYEFYLRSVRKCNNNTAVKYIKNFGKVIRLCIANGWLDKDPFVNYKTKVKEVERVFLNQEELQILESKQFSVDRLNLVKDIFLFSCYTGLAYIDVQKLTRHHISLGIDGEKWIYTTRQKTDTRSNIPLLPVAENILEKYKNHPQCLNQGKLLPILSNQKMNAYLKEIADLCGINKELTFHIARHTFATTVTLTNGVSIESVSKMLGHKSIRTTQHYAKILDKKVSEDMKMLRLRLSNIIDIGVVKNK